MLILFEITGKNITELIKPLPRFKVWGKYILGGERFFTNLFQTNFPGPTQFWGAQKDLGAMLPMAPQWLRACPSALLRGMNRWNLRRSDWHLLFSDDDESNYCVVL